MVGLWECRKLWEEAYTIYRVEDRYRAHWETAVSVPCRNRRQPYLRPWPHLLQVCTSWSLWLWMWSTYITAPPLKPQATAARMKFLPSTISYTFIPTQAPNTITNQIDHKTWNQNGKIVLWRDSMSSHASSLIGFNSILSMSLILPSRNTLMQEALAFIKQ